MQTMLYRVGLEILACMVVINERKDQFSAFDN